MKHLLGIEALTRAQLEALFSDATRLETMDSRGHRDLLRGRVVVTMFFEPSTRTRLSFESAALRLGAGVTGFSEPETTSAKKGESLEDTVRMCAGYGDVLVLRHPLVGAATRAASVSKVPVINAGDGAGEHPSQTLVDLYTILKQKERIDGLRIGIAGDLRYGRTVHSLLLGLAKFQGVEIDCFPATAALALPTEHHQRAVDRGLTFHQADSLQELARRVDVLYMTRVQSERITDPTGADGNPGTYVLRAEHLAGAKADMCVMHPLPRVQEISVDVDATPHALYFQQARNGVPVRQALLVRLLDT